MITMTSVNPERVQNMRSMRSATHSNQSPRKKHTIPTLNDQLLLFNHIFPHFYVFCYSTTRYPLLRFKSALTQSLRQTLCNTPRHFSLQQRLRFQLHRRCLGQHVDHGGFNSLVCGEYDLTRETHAPHIIPVTSRRIAELFFLFGA